MISQGADPAFTPHYSWYELAWLFPAQLTFFRSPIESFATNGICRKPSQVDFCKLANLLGSRSEVNTAELVTYRGPVSAFSALLKYMDTPIEELSFDTRCGLAMELAKTPDFNSPELFLLALGCNPTYPPATQYQTSEGFTLLHSVAGALGVLSAHSTTKYENIRYLVDYEDFELWISGWKSILQELVTSGADVHITGLPPYRGLAHVQATPMLLMFMFAYIYCFGQLPRINPQQVLNSWISTLYDSGVDLIAYGLRERSTWSPLEIDRTNMISDLRDPCYYYFGQQRFIGFDYGQSPKDWILWENEPTDEFAGEFWSMLEIKEEIMPGTWID